MIASRARWGVGRERSSGSAFLSKAVAVSVFSVGFFIILVVGFLFSLSFGFFERQVGFIRRLFL